MAKLELEGFDSFLNGLNSLEFDKLATEMLEAAAPILERNIVKRALSHSRTGSMAGSISKGKLKKNGADYHISVRPTGTDAKGVRNMEKMVYLEYGTSKQAATPVMSPAIAESEESVYAKMQDIFDNQTKELQV